jgi:hypothetical protein
MSNLSSWKRGSLVLVVVLASFVSLHATVNAQRAAKGARAGVVAEDGGGKLKGRLPPYYKDIVDEQQRLEIYRLQKMYGDRIISLEEQIEGIKAERDAAVENVLSPEQKARLNKAREAAAGKRKKGAVAAEKPAAGAAAVKAE